MKKHENSLKLLRHFTDWKEKLYELLEDFVNWVYFLYLFSISTYQPLFSFLFSLFSFLFSLYLFISLSLYPFISSPFGHPFALAVFNQVLHFIIFTKTQCRGSSRRSYFQWWTRSYRGNRRSRIFKSP